MTTLGGHDPGERRMDGVRGTFSGRFVFGFGVLAIGVLFLLDNFGLIDARDYTRYWPVLLLLVGVARLTSARSTPERASAFVWLAAGTLLLLYSFDRIDFDIWDLWPLVLILIGIRLLWRARAGGGPVPATTDPGDRLRVFNFMSGADRKVTSPAFQGGEATAIMGGCEIDLRSAQLVPGGAVIDVFAFWGGIDIFVPGDWTVVNEVQAMLGGIEDTRKERGADGAKRLMLKGVAIMGSVEIKN